MRRVCVSGQALKLYDPHGEGVKVQIMANKQYVPPSFPFSPVTAVQERGGSDPIYPCAQEPPTVRQQACGQHSVAHEAGDQLHTDETSVGLRELCKNVRRGLSLEPSPLTSQ